MTRFERRKRLLSKHSMVEGFLGRDDRKTTAYRRIRENFEEGSDDKSTSQTKLRKKSKERKCIGVTEAFLPPLADLTPYLEQIWDAGILTNAGPLSHKLEEGLKQYLAVDNLSLVTNGTLGLKLAFKALSLKGEVITTPFSYIATTSSLSWCDLTPVFCDIDPTTLNIDAKKIERCITEKTTAILATHVYGNPCHIERIAEIAKHYNLSVIYDAAHAFNVSYDGVPVVRYGDLSMISFHATKIFHTLEGGCLIARNARLHERVTYMKNFGHKGADLDYFPEPGINGKLDEVRSAVGLCMLSHIDTHLARKKDISTYYDTLLFPNRRIRKPLFSKKVTQNYAYYPVIFETEEDLKQVVTKLNQQNIFPRRYFYPSLSSLPYVHKQSTPIADDIASRVLCLPTGYTLTYEEIKKICEIITRALSY